MVFGQDQRSRQSSTMCFRWEAVLRRRASFSIAGSDWSGSSRAQVRFRQIKVTDPDGRLLMEGLPEVCSREVDDAGEPRFVPPDPGWVQLFNGSGLAGWETGPNGQATWQVNGVLVGRGPKEGDKFLTTERRDYKNFHYRIETMVSEGWWSAAIFLVNEQGNYSAAIGGTHRVLHARRKRPGQSWRPGRIPASRTLVDAPALDLRPAEWFTQEVIMVGNKMTILINSRKIFECYDDDNLLQGSLQIYLQPRSILRIKSIEVKELPD